jgi:uncharacterized protein YijF (DUF1287 family)
MFKAVSNITSAHSSGALLYGVPVAVAQYEQMIDNIDEVFKSAAHRAVVTYEKQLRDMARKKGWGSESENVTVTYDPSNIQIVVSGDKGLEYGTGSTPPKPVVRAAITQVSDLEDILTKEIAKESGVKRRAYGISIGGRRGS